MRSNKILILSALALGMATTTQAQSSKFSLNGLGRSLITNSKLDGNLVEGDNTTRTEGMDGYNLFDLQTNLAVDSSFNASAILRVKSKFGSFFGTDTEFSIRQFKMRGQVGDFKYELGDIRMELSPYTIFNPYDMYNKYESGLFAERRSVVEYENFNQGNTWLLQGGQVQYAYDFGGFILGGHGFATRIFPTDDTFTPDRLLAGGRVAGQLGKMLFFGGTYVGLLDVPISTSVYDYSNNVGTGDVEYRMDNDAMKLSVKLEGGASSFSNKNNQTDTLREFKDFFFDLSANVVLKGPALKIGAGFRNVGALYSSPTAQTRRNNGGTTPELFGKVSENSVNRSAIMFDRFTSETMYNAAVSPVLMSFNPTFNNAEPYGKATPNRTGASIVFGSDTSMQNIDFELGGDFLSEVIGEGVEQKRSFMVLKGGARVELGKILGLSRKLDITAGGRFESTSRDGGADVSLTTTTFDAGFSFEVIKKVDLMFGYKMLAAAGNEFLAPRDEFNVVTDFNEVDIDASEGILSVGAMVRFSKSQRFNVAYNMVSYSDNETNANNYGISQLYLGYTGKF